MITYKITEYTKTKANRLGVTVKPSQNKTKKLDVFKKNHRIASIGALGYNDYPTFIKKYGKRYADRRRTLYKRRHETDRHKKWSNGWLADKLLW